MSDMTFLLSLSRMSLLSAQVSYQLPVESTVCLRTSHPHPPPLTRDIMTVVSQDACNQGAQPAVAEADLLGKKYLIIQNGKLGGFSFFHLGTPVLFGVLRAFQILICFYQKKGLWKESGPVPYCLGPTSLYYRFQGCCCALHRRAGHSNPACLPVQSLQRKCLSPGAVHGRTLKVCLRCRFADACLMGLTVVFLSSPWG